MPSLIFFANPSGLYAYPELFVSSVVRLLRSTNPRDIERLTQTLDFMDLSVDEIKSNRFGFRVHQNGQVLTLRQFAAQISNDRFPLSHYVESVTIDVTDVWTCSADLFYENVVSHYNGNLYAWPDESYLKKTFLKLDRTEQLANMTHLREYFFENPNPDVDAFMKTHQTSRGVYEIRARTEKSAAGLEISKSSLQKITQDAESALKKLRELSLAKEAWNRPGLIGDLISYVGNICDKKDGPGSLIDHHLWVLHANSPELQLEIAKLMTIQPPFSETLAVVQDHYKQMPPDTEGDLAIKDLRRSAILACKTLESELLKITRWGW